LIIYQGRNDEKMVNFTKINPRINPKINQETLQKRQNFLCTRMNAINRVQVAIQAAVLVAVQATVQVSTVPCFRYGTQTQINT